jgi:hypothetical protein
LKADVVEERKIPHRHVSVAPALSSRRAFCTSVATGGSAELIQPRERWKPRATDHRSGAICDYVQTRGAGEDGASTHRGLAGEMHVYADL